MSLFRAFKYSALLFYFSKHRRRIFRIVTVLSFAAVTTLLYGDIVSYLEARHPETLIYALTAKIIIVYGALVFVLLQFRPQQEQKQIEEPAVEQNQTVSPTSNNNNRLGELEDLETHATLKSRYESTLQKKASD